VNGRNIIVDGSDDGYANGANNKALTQADIPNDFAMVGSFSLNDSYGGQVLAANPAVPNVTVSLSNYTNNLPNSFSPTPIPVAGSLGPSCTSRRSSRATWLMSARWSPTSRPPSPLQRREGGHAAPRYKVVYDPTFEITTTDFTPYVINMRKAGVKILFIEQMPENYAAAVIKALNQQNFHPVVVLGASTYSEALISAAGGPSA